MTKHGRKQFSRGEALAGLVLFLGLLTVVSYQYGINSSREYMIAALCFAGIVIFGFKAIFPDR